MVATHLCALCRPALVGPFAVLEPPYDYQPPHCYGASDHVNPGVLGGYRCSCKCRDAQPTAQGVGAPAGGEALPHRASQDSTP